MPTRVTPKVADHGDTDPGGTVAARPVRRLPAGSAPLIGVAVAALVFAVLLILVRTQWSPMESLDHGVATHLNNALSGHSFVVKVLKGITWLGSDGVLWTIIVAAVLILAIRRQFRLALYLAVAGAGALILDPTLKSLVGRVRPVVGNPIAFGTGDSFPSGHALGSITCYGALVLVFLPAVPVRFRTAVRTAAIVLVAAIGISRIMLGVHFLSDVIGAWALGIAWLGLTAYAFEVGRRQVGEAASHPVSEGLEPEAAEDLKPAEPEPTKQANHPGRTAAAVAVVWILILGVVIGFGELVTKHGNLLGSAHNVLGDTTVPHWLAAHRTPTLTSWSEVFSTLGATQAILLISIATCVLALAITRRWRPVIFMATLMAGELAMFLVAAAVVKRARPAGVSHLDHHLPTSAYPSGHIAATCCAYIAVAILVIGHARGWWRWLFLVPAIAMPILVIASRMYRGEHHPTDALGSVIFAALWIPLLYRLIHPNADAHQADGSSS
ncbi:MAG TPA: phosphatase PAP2 family protein [Micromonosporaceae bacterium]